jgi:hypothetical protein
VQTFWVELASFKPTESSEMSPVSCCERTKTQIPFEQRPKIQQEVPLLPVQTGRNLRRGALFLVFNMRTDENSDSFEQRPKIF